MNKFFCLVLFSLLLGVSAQTSVALANNESPPAPPTAAEQTDAERLEKSLQALEWEQFKSVVMAIPKLKAEVDEYGPLGWEYVKKNYRKHAWRKSILKMDALQRRQLAKLVAKAKAG